MATMLKNAHQTRLNYESRNNTAIERFSFFPSCFPTVFTMNILHARKKKKEHQTELYLPLNCFQKKKKVMPRQ